MKFRKTFLPILSLTFLTLVSACAGGFNKGGYVTSMDKLKYEPIEEDHRRPIYNEQLLGKQRNVSVPMTSARNIYKKPVQSHIWFDLQETAPVVSNSSPINIPPLRDPKTYAPNIPVPPPAYQPQSLRQNSGINTPAIIDFSSRKSPITARNVVSSEKTKPASMSSTNSNRKIMITPVTLSKKQVVDLAEEEKAHMYDRLEPTPSENFLKKIPIPEVAFDQATPAALR